MIFSSHILAEVSAVCERVVIINKGEILAIDSIDNLERSLMADTQLNLTVEGDQKQTIRLLKDIRGVGNITDVAEAGEGRFSCKVELENEDVRSEIMSVLVANKINIAEMSMAKLTLEQVFLKITAQGKKGSTLQDLLNETPELPADADKE